jgi:hypothetical protein
MDNRPIFDRLSRLPLRALAAFAARCARRVETSSWLWGCADASEAIALAERFARGQHDVLAADVRRILALDLGSFPELGGVIDPAEDGPLGPLWPTHAHDIAGEAVFAHPQTSLTTHA